MEDTIPYALFIDKAVVALRPENLDRNWYKHLVRALRKSIEGRYYKGSYIRKNSATILNRSELTCVQGDPRGNMVCTVEFLADRVALKRESQIWCRIQDLNRSTAACRVGDYQECLVLITRDFFDNASFWETGQLAVGRRVLIQVMPFFESTMYQTSIEVAGKILQVDMSDQTTPTSLPATVEMSAEISPIAGEGWQLGEEGPSIAVVPVVGLGPSIDQIRNSLLQRIEDQKDLYDLRLPKALSLITPFSARGFSRPFYWWETVQRTSVFDEDLDLVTLLVGGTADDLADIQRAITTLSGSSTRLPGEFHHLLPIDTAEVQPVKKPVKSSAVFVVDTLAGSSELPLADVYASEPAMVARMLTAIRSLASHGCMTVTLYPRTSRIFVDWLAWCVSLFHDAAMYRAIAQPTTDPTLTIVLDRFTQPSDTTMRQAEELWKNWSKKIAEGTYVAGIVPGLAPTSFQEDWARFIERNNRAMVKQLRDAIRMIEDEPNDMEMIELEEKRAQALENWKKRFRNSDHVAENTA